ncbi:GNAT family N-acetyltransferase [Sphingobacterium cavernae]|uniref:GNAT family N-acetyltransferase n=1 Tax=Sphingobacterium cavernae TaxID=2592657 RepID=UPI00166649B2|nr:GNAT family N-acetyltransferase [Sphingobacterium cavernae]
MAQFDRKHWHYPSEIPTQRHDLEGILKLWKRHRSTLGLMPRDAFEEHIKKKWILICLNDQNDIVGYLQFRYTYRTQTVSIVHLCVCENLRGTGIAKKLVDNLVLLYKDKVAGIKLSCRSDYHQAIKFWTKYNFQPKHEKPSRGNNPEIKLITWWYNFGKPDLFSSINSNKISVVIDFNIISKLRDIHFYEHNDPEIEFLTEDWITEEFEFNITSETINEIFRDENLERNKKSREFIKSYKELNLNKLDVSQIADELKHLFSGNRRNDISDCRQIAETIVSNISYFITLDNGILRKSSIIEEKYNLKIFHPKSFPLLIDELKNSLNYYPSKLSAGNFFINKLTTNDLNHLNFFIASKVENKRELHDKIKVIQNNKGIVNIVKNKEEYYSIIGYYKLQNNLIVDLLRVIKDKLSDTVIIQNLYEIINYASQNNISFIIINDNNIHNYNLSIFEQLGFFKVEEQFIKALNNKILKYNDFSKYMIEICKKIPQLESLQSKITTFNTDSNPTWLQYYLEKKFWPLKLDLNFLPTYIIPIKPIYARELFDTNSAKSTLFGSSPKLIWNIENVYYRNIHPNIETFPARILWYASSDNNSARQKCIVGVSYLDEIIVGSAKELFKKHKKYGIFDWDKHIMPLTKGNENNEIKILKFSNSESFNRTITYTQLIRLLKEHNFKHNNFVSPVKINSDIFTHIYNETKQ